MANKSKFALFMKANHFSPTCLAPADTGFGTSALRTPQHSYILD